LLGLVTIQLLPWPNQTKIESLQESGGTSQGLIGPNGGALASAAVPDHPGTGSAVLGFVQWVAAGTIAPIAGLGGEHTAIPMATLMIAGAAVSMIGLVLAKPAAKHADQHHRHGQRLLDRRRVGANSPGRRDIETGRDRYADRLERVKRTSPADGPGDLLRHAAARRRR
jgi:hypothetical protein